MTSFDENGRNGPKLVLPVLLAAILGGIGGGAMGGLLYGWIAPPRVVETVKVIERIERVRGCGIVDVPSYADAWREAEKRGTYAVCVPAVLQGRGGRPGAPGGDPGDGVGPPEPKKGEPEAPKGDSAPQGVQLFSTSGGTIDVPCINSAALQLLTASQALAGGPDGEIDDDLLRRYEELRVGLIPVDPQKGCTWLPDGLPPESVNVLDDCAVCELEPRPANVDCSACDKRDGRVDD